MLKSTIFRLIFCYFSVFFSVDLPPGNFSADALESNHSLLIPPPLQSRHNFQKSAWFCIRKFGHPQFINYPCLQ